MNFDNYNTNYIFGYQTLCTNFHKFEISFDNAEKIVHNILSGAAGEIFSYFEPRQIQICFLFEIYSNLSGDAGGNDIIHGDNFLSITSIHFCQYL